MSETAVEVKSQAPAPNEAEASNVGETSQNKAVSNNKNEKIVYGQSITVKEPRIDKKFFSSLKRGFRNIRVRISKNLAHVIGVFAIIGLLVFIMALAQHPVAYSSTPPSVSFISDTEFEYGIYSEIFWEINDLSSPTTSYQFFLDGDVIEEGKIHGQSYVYNYSFQYLEIGRHYLNLRIKDEAFKNRLLSEYGDNAVIIDITNWAPKLSYSSPTKSFEYDSNSILQWNTSDSSIEDPHYEILASAPHVDEENLEFFTGFDSTEFGDEKCYILSSDNWDGISIQIDGSEGGIGIKIHIIGEKFSQIPRIYYRVSYPNFIGAVSH